MKVTERLGERMLFRKLQINYFGCFHNREIELKPGINLIYGENEAGKSTLHTFIRGMLFGIERMRGRGSATKDDLYTRYLPWDYPGAYSGSMDILLKDKEYRLQRSFHANDRSFTILELTTGREIKLREGLISELIPGLTEGTFKNTISIEQLKAKTDAELAQQVRNYITNLSIAKSNEVNVAKAVSMLIEQRKLLETSFITSESEAKALQDVIAEETGKEERIERLIAELRSLFKEEQRIASQKEAALSSVDRDTAGRMEQLPAIMEKYSSYLELIKQENILEEKRKELDVKIAVWEKEQQSIERLKENIAAAGKYQAELAELEKREAQLLSEMDKRNMDRRKALSFSIIPALAAALISLIIFGGKSVGIFLSVMLCTLGLISGILLHRSSIKKLQLLKDTQAGLKQQKEQLQFLQKEILDQYGVSRIEGLSAKREEALRDSYALEHSREQRKDLEKRKEDVQDSRDIMYETIMKYMQYFIEEDELTPSSMQKLQEEIRVRKQENVDKLSEISNSVDNCRLNIEKLKWEIASLEGNEEELLKNKEKYNGLLQNQKETKVELEAVKLALTSIQGLSAEIHDSFGQNLNLAVSEVIGRVTGQKYTDLKVDERLEIKVGRNKDYVQLERLSAGTIDQVYFALRMAAADLLLGEDEMPFLLDDSFAYYDDKRIMAALNTLKERKQVILFTCHKREQALLEKMGLPYHLIHL